MATSKRKSAARSSTGTAAPHVGGQGMGQGRGMNAGEVHRGHNATSGGSDNDQKGGDRSNRAAQSGATGERHPGGGQNKPASRNQDEKGMGHPRNR